MNPLPLFKPGPGHPSLYSASDMNRLVRVINALIRIPGLNISDNNATLDGVGSGDQSSSSTGSSSGLRPFQIFNPTSTPTVFRVRGGSVQVPEYYPADTSNRPINMESTQKVVLAQCTDRVFGDPLIDNFTATNDFTLANWTDGAGVYHACAVFLKVTQSAAHAGTITTAIETRFLSDTDEGIQQSTHATNSFYDIGASEEVIRILLGFIHATPNADGTLTTTPTFRQFITTNIAGLFIGGQFRGGGHETGRVWFPGDTLYASPSVYLFNNYRAAITDPPGSGAPWTAIS